MADSSAPSPFYKMIYFDVRGRAEAGRAMMMLSDVEFEDQRVEFSDWTEMKPTTPTGVLPILETEKGKLVATLAINNFLAARLGFHPQSDWDKARSESLMIYANDLCETVGRLVYVFQVYKFAPEPDNMDENILKAKEAINKTFKFMIGLAKPDTKFLFENKITVADLVLYITVEYCSVKFPEVRTSSERLIKFLNEMEKDEKFANYLKTRNPGSIGT